MWSEVLNKSKSLVYDNRALGSYKQTWNHFREKKANQPYFEAEINKEIELIEKEKEFKWTGSQIVKSRQGKNIPEPAMSFKDMHIHWAIKKNLVAAGYVKPTPIQSHAVPIVLNGRDLMASAETGSGKTAAFLFPILTDILQKGPAQDHQNDKLSPTTLILCPTRELGQQLLHECKDYTKSTPITSCLAIGGVALGGQIARLKMGCDVLIGTPGRVADLQKRGVISLAAIRHLILDEADHMLDMGFEPQIRAIVEKEEVPLKGARQTLLFSATFPSEILNLAEDFLRDQVFIRTGEATTELITQEIIYAVDAQERVEKLKDFISKLSPEETVLMFTNRKIDVDPIVAYLKETGIDAVGIHGDMEQNRRLETLKSFRSKTSRVLVATDVASRGINIPKINWVVNLDFPGDFESYIHRIGRTGRAGNTGKALTFVGPDSNPRNMKLLVQLLRETKQEIPEFLHDLAAGNNSSSKSSFDFGRRGGKGGRSGRRENFAGPRRERRDRGDRTDRGDRNPFGGRKKESNFDLFA